MADTWGDENSQLKVRIYYTGFVPDFIKTVCAKLIPNQEKSQKHGHGTCLKPEENSGLPRLVFITYSGIGDLIMALPLFSALRNKFRVLPLIQSRQSELADILLQDHLFEEDFRIQGTIRFRSDPFGHIETVKGLKKMKPDVILIYGKSLLIIWACLGLVRAPVIRFAFPSRVGPFPPRNQWRVKFTGNPVHDYRRFARQLGIEDNPVPAKLSEKMKKRLRHDFSVASLPPSYAVVSPWSSSAKRNAPLSFFRECIRIITLEGRTPVVVSGTASKTSEAARLMEGLSDSMVINLVGATKLVELMGLIAGAKFILANDSGNIHISTLLNVPVIMAPGPKSPEDLFLPADLPLVKQLRTESGAWPYKPRRKKRKVAGSGI